MVRTAPRTPSECCLPGIRTRWSRWIESGCATSNGPTFGPRVPRTSIESPYRSRGSRRRQGVPGAEGHGGVRRGVRHWRFRHGWDMRTLSGRFVRIEDDSPCRLVRGGAERYTAPYADSFSIHMRASPSGKASASQADTRGFESRCPLQELQGTGDGAFSVSGPISGTRTRWGREAAGTRERSPASARGGRRPPEHAGAAGARESRCPLQELQGTGVSHVRADPVRFPEPGTESAFGGGSSRTQSEEQISLCPEWAFGPLQIERKRGGPHASAASRHLKTIREHGLAADGGPPAGLPGGGRRRASPKHRFRARFRKTNVNPPRRAMSPQMPVHVRLTRVPAHLCR